MANYVGGSIFRLIRAYCYTGGEKCKLKRQLASAEARIRVTEAHYREAEAQYNEAMAVCSSLKEDYGRLIDRLNEIGF